MIQTSSTDFDAGTSASTTISGTGDAADVILSFDLSAGVSWTHVSNDWLPADVGHYAAPAFADIDNDGDFDLVVGDSEGYVEYFRNDGDIVSPSWTHVSNDWLPVNVKVKFDSQSGHLSVETT